MYYLTKWKERVGELSGDSQLKNLNEEVGIMRMMLEETLNRCDDADELLNSSPRITSMVDKVQNLVATIDRMDARAALPPDALSKIAAEWIQIICVYVTNQEQLEELSEKLIASTERAADLALLAGPPPNK